MLSGRRRAALLAVAVVVVAPAAAQGVERRTAPAGAFVSLRAVDPSIRVELRYLTAHNFVGRRIPGYRQNVCILTRQAARALKRVQRSVRARGYTLKVYDCYRPQRAVNSFVAWAREPDDEAMKREFYPRVEKADLFEDGYIAAKSGHSRGSTVDLTLVELPPGGQERYEPGDPLRDCAGPVDVRFGDNTIDMGTGYDCFDPRSHTFDARIKGAARRNRLKLREPMIRAGFKGLRTEWWHFTLRDEPYPGTFFDFPVARASLR